MLATWWRSGAEKADRITKPFYLAYQNCTIEFNRDSSISPPTNITNNRPSHILKRIEWVQGTFMVPWQIAD